MSGVRMRLSTFPDAFRAASVGLKLYCRTSSDRNNKLHMDAFVARNDFICARAHFGMYFESIRVGVKRCSTMGSDGYNTLHTDDVVPQNETKCLTPRMDFICALEHHGMPFESVRVGTKRSCRTGFSGYNKLYVDEFTAQNETECKTP